jgi:Domain of unknown function (DUF4440)
MKWRLPNRMNLKKWASCIGGRGTIGSAKALSQTVLSSLPKAEDALLKKSIWIGLGAASVIAMVASAQQSKWAAGNDETAQSLIKLERQWAEAACDGNLGAETMLADDFQGTAPDGTRYTKAQEVQDIKAKHDSRECQLGDARVHFFGEALALIYGSESRLQKDGDGTERTRTLIWTDTWLKRNGKWQVVAAQDTRVDGK